MCQTINYSKEEFKKDIKKKQEAQKKVFISIGGEAGGQFKLTNDKEVENFVNSVKQIVDEYGFDGIDIDIESGDIEIQYCENALTQIYNIYKGKLLISINSSITGMKSADVNEGIDNLWYKIGVDLKDKIWLNSTRYYNSGTQSGYDYKNIYSREQGHISFITSIAVKQLEDKELNNNNIGITVLAYDYKIESLPQAYMPPKDIVKAISSIMDGIDLNLEYKDLKAVSIWSINKDAYYNYQMAKEIKQYLNENQI